MRQILFICMAILCAGVMKAQGGLEGIIVEKYYVAGAADNAADPTLPVGATAYRVYVDMLPGYELQAIYGQTDIPAGKVDTLKLYATAPIWNDASNGAVFGNAVNKASLINAASLSNLDSWFTTGRVGTTTTPYLGIPKADDTNGTIFGAHPLYNNASGGATNLKTVDGYAGTGSSVAFSDPAGLETLMDPILGNVVSGANPSFETFGGALGLTVPLLGPTADNKVLIGQFTTTGFLGFQLNLQIRSGAGVVEQWVAKTPQVGQFSHSTLIREPNPLPTITITSPLGGASFTAGQPIAVTATATDVAPGTVSRVDFSYNGVTVSDNAATAPDTYDTGVTPFTAANGISTITAKVFDNSGDSVTTTVNILVGANTPPVVTLGTLPAPSYIDSTVVLTATATDANGIASVTFFVNGLSVGVGTLNAGVYSLTWSTAGRSRGNYNVTATAIDALGGSSTTTPSVLALLNNGGNKYEVREVVAKCNEDNICVPISAIAAVEDVIGYDIVLKYPSAKVIPTGIIRKGGVLSPNNLVETSFSIPSAGKMLLSVYFNTNAPLTQRFTGIGDIVCVEFEKTPAFLATDSVEFVVETLKESYITGVIEEPVDTNSYITYKDTIFNSSLIFWADEEPISYVLGTNLITNIYGADNADCLGKELTGVTPDANGLFSHNLNKGLYLSIDRDIAPATSVQPVINGFDALLVRRVLIEDLSFIPSIYQMMAMDVNMDGVVSAGDASQINQRSILRINEFRQEWNYTDAGVSNGQLSKDWFFIDESTPLIDARYSISANYPRYDQIGYNKDNVPTPDFCRPTPVSNFTRCAVIGTERYVGVLLGDVNGSYSTLANSVGLRGSEGVKLGLANATFKNGEVTIPVYVNASNEVNAVDFALQFNEQKLTFSSTTANASVQNVSFFNTDDKTLRMTSNALSSFNINQPVAFVTFTINDANITERDFNNMEGYLNGEKVSFDILNTPSSTDNKVSTTAIYPNPTSGTLNIVTDLEANVELLDLNGSSVLNLGKTTNGMNYFDVSTITPGFYTIKLTSGDKVEVKKLLITK